MLDFHRRQQVIDGHNWTCGATCLEMVFDHFGIPYGPGEVWAAVRSLRAANDWYARTCHLAEYAIHRGLNATIYRARGCDILDKLDALQLPAILNITQQATGAGHFIVYRGKEAGGYRFCDPYPGEGEPRYPADKLRDAWKYNASAGVTGYILIVFSPAPVHEKCCRHCGKPVPLVCPELLPLTSSIICPHCDRGM